MFVIIVTYVRPLEDVDCFLEAHRDYLAALNEAGKLICAGPQTPRVGGVIMLKGNDLREAQEIVAHDPFNINGIARYQIVEFAPNRFSDERLEDFLM